MTRMFTVVAAVAVAAFLVTASGCQQGGNGDGKSSFWGGSDEGGRSMWLGGSPSDNQWGSGFKGLFDARTYDPDVLAASHDLADGKLVETRILAARTLGDINADVNIAIEALEEGTKDSNQEVRMASADALQRIGSPNALHHLKEAQEKGRVPMGQITYDRTTAIYVGTQTRSEYRGEATTMPADSACD